MSHLHTERLAALVDEPPTPAELSHLSSCAACASERAAYVTLGELAHGARSIGQPLSSWQQLAPALRRDGVIETGRGFHRSASTRAWMQAAAAVILLVGGVAAGRLSATRDFPGMPAATVANVDGVDGVDGFRSISEAETVAARSKAALQNALAFLDANNPERAGASTPAAIRTQLARMDGVTQNLAAALEEAPYDPTINTMYLNSQRYREATLRQLGSASMRMQSW